MADQLTQTANQAVQNVAPPTNLGFLDGSVADTNGALIKQPTVPVVPVAQITPQQKIDIPNTPPSPDTSGALATSAIDTSKSLQDYITALTPEPTALDKTQQNTLDKIASLTAQDTGKEQYRVQQENTNGADRYTKELNDLNGQITTSNAEYQSIVTQENNALSKIQGNAIFGDEMNSDQRAITRNFAILKASKAAELGVLSARAQATQGNLTTAIALADRAVTLKYQPIEDEIRIREAQLKSIEPLLNKQEKVQALAQQVKLQDRQKAIDDAKEKEKQINELALKASSFGAPADVVNAITKSGSVVEAINAAGKYTADPLEKIMKATQIKKIESDLQTDVVQRQKIKSDIQVNNSQMAKIANEIRQGNAQLNVPAPNGSAQSVVQKLLNSANSKENLSSGEREKIAKALTVIGQLDTLQSNIGKQNSTGFFKGKVQNFLSSIGQNADAGVINAQLQALVPNLARGTYGEVGVLTDADITNYKKTLPNLTSPKDQNDAVLALTLKTVKKSIENTLSTAANSGVNVSGFAQQYVDLTNQINTIEDRIGVAKQKVDTIWKAQPTLQPVMKEMFEAGGTDREVLDALNLNN